jgi:hypothetical protein
MGGGGGKARPDSFEYFDCSKLGRVNPLLTPYTPERGEHASKYENGYVNND